jgi:hypothetical protein
MTPAVPPNWVKLHLPAERYTEIGQVVADRAGGQS